MISEILSVIGIGAILGYAANRFYFSGGVFVSKKRLDGKVAIVTGANTGIGYETALELARRRASVVMACRDVHKAEKAAQDITLITGNKNVRVEQLDLADLDSVRSFAARMSSTLTRLDMLINNAGIMMCPNWRTKQGFEMQFGVNHLGHFLLTKLMLDLLEKAGSSRVVTVSSRAHFDFGMHWQDLNWRKTYSAIPAYSQSKTANVLFAKELAKRYKDKGIVSVSLHPGVVRTELTRYMGAGVFVLFPLLFRLVQPFFYVISKSSWEGAQTSLHCAIADEVANHNGSYFRDCKPSRPSKEAEDPECARKLWEISEKLIASGDKD